MKKKKREDNQDGGGKQALYSKPGGSMEPKHHITHDIRRTNERRILKGK